MHEAGPAGNRSGIIDLSFAMALFIVNDALVKLVSESLPGLQLIFIRGLFACLLMLALCAATRAFKPDSTHGQWPARQLFQPKVLIRGSLDATASLIYLTAMFHMPLANATAINMASPLFITLIAIQLFKERVSVTQWLAIGVGFLGVILIVQPAASGFNAWALMCLAGTVLHAGRDVMTRVLPGTIPALLITLSTVISVTLLSGVLMLFQGWQSPTVRQMALLATAGVLLSGGYFFLTRAMRKGQMSVVAPFRYSGLLFAIVLGWLVWGEIPNTLAFVGIILMVGAGLYMLHIRQPAAAQTFIQNPD